MLDHCLPRRLAKVFPNHDVRTAADMGWDRLRNGKLLAAAAAAGFEVVLTIDKKMSREQNLATLPVAVVVVMAVSNRLADLQPMVPAIEQAFLTVPSRTLVEVLPG